MVNRVNQLRLLQDVHDTFTDFNLIRSLVNHFKLRSRMIISIKLILFGPCSLESFSNQLQIVAVPLFSLLVVLRISKLAPLLVIVILFESVPGVNAQKHVLGLSLVDFRNYFI